MKPKRATQMFFFVAQLLAAAAAEASSNGTHGTRLFKVLKPVCLSIITLAGTWLACATAPAVYAEARQMKHAAVGPQNTPVRLQEYPELRRVAPGVGSDRSGDGSAEKPWASIEHALSQVNDAAASKRYAVLVAAGRLSGPTIQMKQHVDLYGGFESSGWTRDIFLNVSILDGQNAHRVAIGADNARLDGFTVARGQVRGPGGGLLCARTSPTITNNTFIGNSTQEPADYVYGLVHQAGHDGGAIACINGAMPVISNNLITGNSTAIGGGGGIGCSNYSYPVIVNNVICDNVTGVNDDDPDLKKRARGSNGAAISVARAPFKEAGSRDALFRMKITGNVILHNRAGGNSDAGGVYCEYDADPVITSNYLLGNVAEDDGAAIYVMKSSEPIIDSNVVAGNKAGSAVRFSKEGRGRLFNNLIVHNDTIGVNCNNSWMIFANNTVADNTLGLTYSNAKAPHIKPFIVTNSIIHDNASGDVNGEGEAPIVSHCNVGGGSPGKGNIDAAPMFVDDGRAVRVTSMAYDAARAQTTLRTEDRPDGAGDLVGRVIRAGDRWSVIVAATAGDLVAWGDLRSGGGGERLAHPVEINILPTYRLAKGSPCIDKGTPINAPEHDIDGNSRIAGSVDIGADEYHTR